MRAINRVGRVRLTVQAKELEGNPCFALERRGHRPMGFGHRRAPLPDQSGRDMTQPLIRL